MDRIFLIQILESGDPAFPELMVFCEIWGPEGIVLGDSNLVGCLAMLTGK